MENIRQLIKNILLENYIVEDETPDWILGRFNDDSGKYDLQMGAPANKYTSGWKVHIYGEDVGDSIWIYENLSDYLKRKNVPFKIATLRRYKGSGPQSIKAATIYMPNYKEFRPILTDLISLMQSYPKKGQIGGDRHIGSALNYRYDLPIPIQLIKPDQRPGLGGDDDFYRPNDGNYNIEGNIDPLDYKGPLGLDGNPPWVG